jgi:probable F420-dependent oxidoreductase
MSASPCPSGSRPKARPSTNSVRPFRFLADAFDAASARELGERARAAEAMGVTAFVLPDHLVPQLAPIPYLATIAALTDRLRISAFVHNNDLRHPAVLAQELATLDVLSGGRLDVAIGAGWNEPEYRAIGLPFDPIRVRQARLAEAIAVLKGCFGEGAFSFAGEHYTITDYDAYPKPIQQPYPPIFIGGGGRATLTLAAREANIVGLAPRILSGQRPDPRSITWAATEEKIGWVREAAGERFDDLEFNVYPTQWPIVVTDDLRGEARRFIESMTERTGIELTEQEVIDSPHVYIGSIDRFVEKFSELRERLGINSFLVGSLDELGPVVERLAGT